MNFWWWLNFQPKGFCKEWLWFPKVKYDKWPIKKGGNVWYFSFRWLNFGFNIDNEWS